MSLEIVSIIVTISLAFLGYMVTYWNNLENSKRQARLNLIDKRMSEFYGPLFISTQASRKAFKAMIQQLGPKSEEMLKSGKGEQELLRKWRIWLENVFMPINREIEKLIVNKAYLIQEEEMPTCMLDFITHVSAYKAGLSAWKEGEPLDIDSIIDYPKELDIYASKSYKNLKIEQLSLIGYFMKKSNQKSA